MRIDKVYTRTGDEGQTSLSQGERVSKSSLRVVALGEVDELNSLFGVIRAKLTTSPVQELLGKIQGDLFVLGADLSSTMPKKASGVAARMRRVGKREVETLEEAIDRYNEMLPSLEEFILPDGGEAGAMLHLSRAVARRSERAVAALVETETVNPLAMVYLNRLSDLLFVLARKLNRDEGRAETKAEFH
jgi:cob(I)alamin adenosyltransferase